MSSSHHTGPLYAHDPLAERTWMLVSEWGVATCMKCGMWFSYKREHRKRLPITCNVCDVYEMRDVVHPTPLAGT
jgi:hypothetical protein